MPKHKLYILRWNPTFSMKYESHLEGMRMLKNNPITNDWSIYEYEELKTHIIPDERIVMTDIDEDTVITPNSTLEQIADCFNTIDINDYNDYFDDEDDEE